MFRNLDDHLKTNSKFHFSSNKKGSVLLETKVGRGEGCVKTRLETELLPKAQAEREGLNLQERHLVVYGSF